MTDENGTTTTTTINGTTEKGRSAQAEHGHSSSSSSKCSADKVSGLIACVEIKNNVHRKFVSCCINKDLLY